MTGHRPFADLKKGWSDDRGARNQARKAEIAVEYATLEELRSRLPVAVSVPTLSRTLLELKLSFKKKFCLRPSKTDRMSNCGDRLGRPR